MARAAFWDGVALTMKSPGCLDPFRRPHPPVNLVLLVTMELGTGRVRPPSASERRALVGGGTPAERHQTDEPQRDGPPGKEDNAE